MYFLSDEVHSIIESKQGLDGDVINQLFTELGGEVSKDDIQSALYELKAEEKITIHDQCMRSSDPYGKIDRVRCI